MLTLWPLLPLVIHRIPTASHNKVLCRLAMEASRHRSSPLPLKRTRLRKSWPRLRPRIRKCGT
ncbi:hypothetical protein ANCCAN_24645 [Ancylostoma caninum]|uniref:Uncharacterized protein n=1 Tax=Ancylostoma caninum TaxID=29170 RepID=A0A368FF02_ANCCA|nr:hypothetical protein ANCCAN_24645 [Ancylostoma caninum]